MSTGRCALSVGYRGPLSGLSFGALLADRGFDSDRLRSLLASLGLEAVVPPKANRKKPSTATWRVRETAPRGELPMPDHHAAFGDCDI